MKQFNLLIIDDEDNIRKALARTFRKDGYRIDLASSAEAAYKFLFRTKYDVIVCDHRMPGISGAELLSRIREQSANAVKIMISGQADFEAVVKMINDKSVDRYIAKPWDDDELRAIVAAALAEREAETSQAPRSPEDIAEDEVFRLEMAHPGISSVFRDLQGTILID